MTLEKAVEALNREEHRNWNPWTIQPAVPGCTPVYVICDGEPDHTLYEFEAIAIAEKYEREGYRVRETPSDKERICPYCNQTFPDVASRQKHLAAAHPGRD